MNKIFICFKTSLFALLSLMIQGKYTYAQQSTYPLTYTCYKTDRQVKIDGIINDGSWKDIEWSETFVDIEGDLKPVPEFETKVKMLWDDSCLYIAAFLEEPHVWATLTERESVIFHDNDFEVFIDPDSDGLNYYEFEINAFGTEWDLMLSKPYSKRGKPDDNWNIEGVNSGILVYGTINDPRDVDSAWTVEIAMPWESLVEYTKNQQKPMGGERWRINFSRVEWEVDIIDNEYKKRTDTTTGKFLPEKNWVWSPQGKINMHIPEMWGYLNFSDSIVAPAPTFWVWMGANNEYNIQQWDSLFNVFSDMGIEGLLIGADIPVLARIIPVADSYDLDVHAWFWTMNRSDASPEWLSVNRNGRSLAEEKAYVNYYKFMCPALPEVKDFLKKKMDYLSSVKGLKGIHMDYIRYVDAILPVGLQPKYGIVQDSVFPEYDYGYHPYMLDLFKKEFGYHPLDSSDPATNREWLQFRLQQLNSTVDMLDSTIRYHEMIPSAAVFPTPSMSKEMVRQDWKQWNLPFYFPMVYHNFYDKPISWISEVMRENRRVMPANAKLFCGLYLPSLKNNNDLTEAMHAAMDGGADGVAFFDLNAMNKNLIDQIKQFIYHGNYRQ